MTKQLARLFLLLLLTIILVSCGKEAPVDVVHNDTVATIEPLLTPSVHSPDAKVWKRAEIFFIPTGGHTDAYELGIGAGNFEKQGGQQTAMLWIAHPDPYESRVVTVHEEMTFNVGKYDIRLDEVNSRSVLVAVSPPLYPATPDPRFEEEDRADYLLPENLPYTIALGESDYRMIVTQRPSPGHYQDRNGNEVLGYTVPVEIQTKSGEMVKVIEAHAGSEIVLPGVHTRIFFATPWVITLGVTDH